MIDRNAQFKAEQLDQLLAPIGLYPDALLTQILMAATYSLEIVKADRWLQDPGHANLREDQLAGALEAETWDPSVKSLVPFPQILRMMDEQLDWTEQLGNAVPAQQPDVMDAIQRLRYQAAAAGTLWSNTQQRVTTERQGIVIEPANPEFVYPPIYSPAGVYGPWPYPDYPPLDISPLGTDFGLAGPFGIGFGAGFFVVRPLSKTRFAFMRPSSAPALVSRETGYSYLGLGFGASPSGSNPRNHRTAATHWNGMQGDQLPVIVNPVAQVGRTHHIRRTRPVTESSGAGIV
jgi:hypothetical protein